MHPVVEIVRVLGIYIERLDVFEAHLVHDVDDMHIVVVLEAVAASVGAIASSAWMSASVSRAGDMGGDDVDWILSEDAMFAVVCSMQQRMIVSPCLLLCFWSFFPQSGEEEPPNLLCLDVGCRRRNKVRDV